MADNSLHMELRGGILRINRKAVRRVVENRQVSLKPQTPKRRSVLDCFKSRIDEMLKQDPTLTATRIMQQIKGEG